MSNLKNVAEAQINLAHEFAQFIKEYTKAYDMPNDMASLLFLLKDVSPRTHFKMLLMAQLAGSKIKKQPLGSKRKIKYASEVNDATTSSI